MAKTTIEWTDRTWNFIRGCSRVSAGCEGCYAEAIARRFSGAGLPYEGTISERGKWNGNITFHEDKLLEALRWKKPQRVFVNSMSDLFHENVNDEWIDKAFAVMSLTPHITYQILTKRSSRMLEYFDANDGLTTALRIETCRQALLGKQDILAAPYWAVDCSRYPLPNVHLGVSVESPDHLERMRDLSRCPAAVHFVSAEPLLADLGEIRGYLDQLNNPWVIVGGESGPNARPVHPEWVRSIRDQCVAAGVPFFFKQYGEWAPGETDPAVVLWDSGRLHEIDPEEWGDFSIKRNGVILSKVGKKKAGRLIDGREWNEFPEVKK